MNRLQDRPVGSAFELAGRQVPALGVGLQFLERLRAGVDDKSGRKNRRRTFEQVHGSRA